MENWSHAVTGLLVLPAQLVFDCKTIFDTTPPKSGYFSSFRSREKNNFFFSVTYNDLTIWNEKIL